MTRRGNTKTRLRERERALCAAVAAKLIGNRGFYIGAAVIASMEGGAETGVIVAQMSPNWWKVRLGSGNVVLAHKLDLSLRYR